MNTNDTNQTEPDTKRADQLAVGDHVIEQPGHAQDDQPMRVTAAQPYLDGNRRQMVSLLLDALDGTEPMYVRAKPDKPYDLATADDLADLTAGARRTAMVRALHQLAADIADHKLPVPRNTLHIGGVVESRTALEAWAAHLGAEIEAGGTDGDIPALRHEVKVADGPTFYIGWQSPAEPKPAPDQLAEARALAAAEPLSVENAIAAAKALEPKPTGEIAKCGCPFFRHPIGALVEVIHDTACPTQQAGE